MKTFVTAAGLAIGASAAILPRSDECCFQLSASGGQSGTLGQLDDGQNRIGGGLGKATYCINNGQITDESGRGCILTAPTTQFQCDKGASPDGGFSVGGNGMLQHDSDSTFYACPADEGEYNIYTKPVDNQPKCVEVQLSVGGKCKAVQSQSAYTTPAAQTCPPQSTVTKEVYKTVTEQGKDSTIVRPTTIYQTKTIEETEVATKPTTIYQTKTIQETVTAEKPTTIYQTKTIEETETATVPTTIYKTEQQTVTAEKPTTIYQTKTIEQTETAKVPVTQYQTKTIQQTVTAEKPTTVYQTKVVEETQTKQAPAQTQYVTKTEQGQASTITKVVTQVETQQGKPQTQYITKTEQQPCTQQPEQLTKTVMTGTFPAEQLTKTVATGTTSAETAQVASSCPTNLGGEYQYPHLIVPVSSEHPDQSYGTSYNGMMNSSMSSIFNFDIPQSYQGQTCSLVFMFPKKEDLETSDYTFNGEGSVSVDHMSGVCKEGDSYNSAPKVDNHMGDFTPQPGNSYVVATGECAAGMTQSYEMSAHGGMSMDFFQDYNPSPLGLYITVC